MHDGPRRRLQLSRFDPMAPAAGRGLWADGHPCHGQASGQAWDLASSVSPHAIRGTSKKTRGIALGMRGSLPTGGDVMMTGRMSQRDIAYQPRATPWAREREREREREGRSECVLKERRRCRHRPGPQGWRLGWCRMCSPRRWPQQHLCRRGRQLCPGHRG